MPAPPSLAGALQSSRMASVPWAVAVRLVGASGTVASAVVSEAVSEGSEVPAALIAETR